MIKNFCMALLAIILMFGTTSCVERVDSGKTGILVNLAGSDRGVDHDVKVETGWVLYNPFSKQLFEYPSYNMLVDYSAFTIQDKKGTEFKVDPTIEYQIERDSATLVFLRYRLDIKTLQQTIILNEVKNAYKDISGIYETDSIINFRPQFEGEVQDLLTSRLASKGFSFRNIQSSVLPNETLQNEINAKNAAVQRALKEENNKKAEQAIADQKVISANGVAEANRKLQTSLTPMLIQQQWIQKWDGKVPTVNGGGNGMILDISNLK